MPRGVHKFKKTTQSSASLQLLEASTFIDSRVWLPHLGQCLSTEREHGNAEDHFAIAVREHSDLFAGGGRAMHE